MLCARLLGLRETCSQRHVRAEIRLELLPRRTFSAAELAAVTEPELNTPKVLAILESTCNDWVTGTTAAESHGDRPVARADTEQ